jgi:energy-coupling factor transporter ATP-binding protein EcfA2
MKLTSIQYSQHTGTPEAWQLEKCILNDINLVVGKNATGKTRMLNVIVELSNLLSGDMFPGNSQGDFTAVFDNAGVEMTYHLNLQNEVIQEQLQTGNQLLLSRQANGRGQIFAVALDKNVDFQLPTNELMVRRRDLLQYPFLEELYHWGKATRYFQFGTAMGQNTFPIFLAEELEKKDPNLKDFRQVVAVFRKGELEYGKDYLQHIIADMKQIGYELEDLSIQPLTIDRTLRREDGQPAVAYGIRVKERNLTGITPHLQISSGMFRAMSLFIQVNYSLLASLPSCIIIDDIGEGLDYTRATDLIELLIRKVEGTNIQLIMSTNDQFVMDAIPLKYWLVIQRLAGQAKIYSYRNSQPLFEDFKFTGLGNFDFFSSNYFLKDRVSQS